MLARMRELSTQGASTSASSGDKQSAATEYNVLVDEIDRIAKSTQFNKQNLLDGSGSVTVQTDPNSPDSIKISLGDMTASGQGLSKVSADGSDFSIVGTQIDAATATVNTQKSKFKTAQSTLETTLTNLNAAAVATNPTSDAPSRINDVDMDSDTASLKQQALSKAGNTLLTQANQTPQSVLNLLR